MVTFRIDDISQNTNFQELKDIIQTLNVLCKPKIILGVTLLSTDNGKKSGQIYDGDAPFKDNPKKWFYKCNSMWARNIKGIVNVASHGLIHLDHSRVGYDAQEMNILTSCNLLKTNMFIPPFNRYNEDTVKICEKNGIELLVGGWKSLKFNEYDPEHEKWYLHPWEWKQIGELCKKLEAPKHGTVTIQQ